MPGPIPDPAVAVAPAGAEPVVEPALHPEDLVVLNVADRLGQVGDRCVVRQVTDEELLRHHHGHHVVGDHVLEEGAVEPVAREAGEVTHHRPVVHLGGPSRIPLGQPPLHLVDLGRLGLDDRPAEGTHLRPARPPQLLGRCDRLLVVGDHLGQVGELAVYCRFVHPSAWAMVPAGVPRRRRTHHPVHAGRAWPSGESDRHRGRPDGDQHGQRGQHRHKRTPHRCSCSTACIQTGFVSSSVVRAMSHQ